MWYLGTQAGDVETDMWGLRTYGRVGDVKIN
jgi:hypothetical protein